MAKTKHAEVTYAECSPLERLTTVAITGACVMVVEILGARVIGPAFGVSLFVWSALLAVTLGSLAVGYYLGGVVADRRPTATTLHAAVLLAGLTLALAPLLRRVVLMNAQALGPRIGPLLSATILFGPALVALGTIGPITTRLASADVGTTGRRVGNVFAVSTAGSLCGTFLVGYWLIPSYDLDWVLVGTATLLSVLGAVPLAMRWRSGVLAAALAPWLVGYVPHTSLPSGYEIIDRSQSPYGVVEVIHDHQRHARFLRVDHSVIGADVMPEHDSAFTFIYLLELVAPLRPRAKSMLQLGLGTGSLARSLKRTGIDTDVVEIDTAVIAFAKQYFAFVPTGEVFTEDARTFLNRSHAKYDIVVHDTFTGGSTPEHLLTREVIERVRAMLNPGGILALNFVGGTVGPEAEATALVAQTLRAVFPHVRVFRDEGPAEERIVNVVFFASETDLALETLARVRFRDPRRESALRSLFSREIQPRAAQAITDARNPLHRLELPIAEQHALAMNRLLPPAVWIH